MTTATREETFGKVKSVLVEALQVDPSEIREDVTLSGDLGAESIDYLDIQFRLEKAFSFKIPKNELFPAEELVNNPQFVDNGRLTSAGIARLKELLPHADFARFEKEPVVAKIPDLYTVGTLVRFIEAKRNAG